MKFPRAVRVPFSTSADKAPKLSYGVCDGLLTGLAGRPTIARLARFPGLPWKFQKHMHVKRHRCGSSDMQSLLTLVYSLATGSGHLNAVDGLESANGGGDPSGRSDPPAVDSRNH